MDSKTSVNLVNEDLIHYGAVNPAFEDEGTSDRDQDGRSGNNSSRKTPLDTYFNEQVEVPSVSEVRSTIIN